MHAVEEGDGARLEDGAVVDPAEGERLGVMLSEGALELTTTVIEGFVTG